MFLCRRLTVVAGGANIEPTESLFSLVPVLNELPLHNAPYLHSTNCRGAEPSNYSMSTFRNRSLLMEIGDGKSGAMHCFLGLGLFS
jgi:hypothetical protein